ncbi:MAG: serine/threonine protein kinase [Myxococcales bacterium]|nr:serine/threonine protein kinase [Myxococcales bacterium]
MSQIVRAGQVSPEESVLPDAPSRYVVGEIVADKYKLISQLGEGGMGSVWVAKNLALDAQVALKLIRGDMATKATEDRFLTEARAAARLKHPAICRVFDFGRTRHDEPFMVMELMQGETLGEVLDRERQLPAVQAVQILLPIADALGSAHARGVVHRDLKPDNIYLADTDGRLQPKILDFGIAKLAASNVSDHRITQAGTVVGSPDYMAPEQARGMEDIDHRADIWELCVLLYECVTGRVPFEDANYNALLRHIIEDEIRPILEFGAGDAELWAVMQKGFEKDREKRYQSMRELGEALAAWLMARGVMEDVSGHSLRATWVEPMPTGRISLVSLATARASTPPPALIPARQTPQVEIATVPPAPIVESAPAPPLPARSPKRRVALIAMVVVVAMALAGFFAVRASVGGTTPPVAAGPDEGAHGAPQAAPPATAAPTPAAPAPPEPAGAEPAAAAPGSARGKKKALPAAAPPTPEASAKSSPTAAPTPAKPKGGYAEDLGF